ncbi:DUF1294 domain-containing protein [Anaerostipes sp.]|uniref:DUF1294 domain-containing protein n=1 Tax=Anaerostipes sp. TaxID=1872530 RepID=UPI0025B8C312|nr:DUF1294 domain-containing protein [Anaerostipes sp.]MBS7008695.1 DUF1294 domain-containing protein [Anaerostipes sp.]
MKLFIVYLIFMNVITFLIYGSDKQRAKKNRWRIPEKTLLFLALAGGSLGALLAMQTFRHKTRKPLFRYGIPVMILCQAAVCKQLLTLL